MLIVKSELIRIFNEPIKLANVNEGSLHHALNIEILTILWIL